MKKKIIIIILLIFNIVILFPEDLAADSTGNENWRDFVFDKEVWDLGAVNRLAASGKHLFASGYFSQRSYDKVLFNCIAELQDTKWLPLGTGVYAGVRGGWITVINDILIKNGNLYVVGCFDTAGTIKANNIAKWNINSRTWSSVGKGTDGFLVSVVEMNNKIYIGGRFDSLYTDNDTIIAHNIAVWDGNNWHNLGNGLNAPVESMFVTGNNLYVAGEFDTVGTSYSKHFGIWNDSTNLWSGFDKYGPAGDIFAVCKIGSSVYFGGYFDSVNTANGSIKAKNITRWDGSSWYALDDGIDGHIHRLKTDGENLYIAGSFEKVKNDSDFCENIVKWDGTYWQFLGSGADMEIRDITFWGDSLLVGGSFSFTGDTLATHIGLWYAGELPGIINPPNNGNENDINIKTYPNPTNSEVIVDFYVGQKSLVKIKVFDMLGNKREILVERIFDKGWHQTTWNSSKYDKGTYFIDMNVGDKNTTTKLIVSE